VIRLSIATRQALAKLILPVLIAVSFGLMLLGKADALPAERARSALADGLAPLYAALAAPLNLVRAGVDGARNLVALSAENARLRAENERLRQWQWLALTLDAENQRLRANLNWIPDPAVSFVTAHVVADAGGVYVRAVLLSVGPHHAIKRGEIALDEHGLVGRVTEVGERSARVLLLTDLNSRIPVTLEESHGRAILAGNNRPRPRLLYWPEDSPPREGELVVTSAEAGAFPADLPVGTVHYGPGHAAEVEPAADFNRLEIIRIFDYGLQSLAPPEAPGHPALAQKPRS
jgi:rod shape-determining protein MreC